MSNPETLDLLIRGATALTADPAAPLIEDAAIGIRGDRIAVIGPSTAADATTARRIIDARGHLATPGFVNVHTHTVLAHARGTT
jgi:5-methylthioadenosine/S-adenosylhomocysteine deaminase